MNLRHPPPFSLSTRPFTVVLLGAACAMSTPSRAADSEAATHARNLAATCTACHGTDGRATAGGTGGMPSLAGRPAQDTAARMRAYKAQAAAHAGGANVMQQIAAGYDDAQIDAIAHYFARQTSGSQP